MPSRFVCVHGHFYQPPRENPWLEVVEAQPSAAPYHDWNQRIAAECYQPNAAARILDDHGLIEDIVSNYRQISFDFGPTLLSWLRTNAPEAYASVLEADRVAHTGMAQAYSHMIMPLANDRDRATQVLWGMRDFAHRFGRQSEGMWLPETAVNLATLEALALAGVKFTILAPHQARRIRRLRSGTWEDTAGSGIDTTRAYEIHLPSGRRLALFFYDGGIAQSVAFQGLLRDGLQFANRLLAPFSPARAEPRLVHIATDGETYGHHHRFGEMALAAALRFVAAQSDTAVTNYTAFLASHPPRFEVEIHQDTSWSCAHGVERWRGDCGCNSGGHPGWKQAWRGPLRAALDWLRDSLAPAYERAAAALLHDPWAARDDFIAVLLDPAPAATESFFARHARRPLLPGEQAVALRWLELQHQAMLMFTSCGWFFDEISGIETVQILQYAARAIELGEALFGLRLRDEFLQRLAAAPSNLPQYGNGRGVFEQLVEAARARAIQIQMERVARAYAAQPGDSGLLREWLRLARAARTANISVTLWESQNIYWQLRRDLDPFRELGEALGFRS